MDSMGHQSSCWAVSDHLAGEWSDDPGSGVLSSSAPLATCEKAIDKENDYSADHTTNEACEFSGIIPADSLAKISRDERTYNSQNSRQNKAFRLVFVTGHNELGNHSNDKANNDCPKDAHPSAPVLNQALASLIGFTTAAQDDTSTQ
jgi:hypothetical protein